MNTTNEKNIGNPKGNCEIVISDFPEILKKRNEELKSELEVLSSARENAENELSFLEKELENKNSAILALEEKLRALKINFDEEKKEWESMVDVEKKIITKLEEEKKIF